MTESKERRVERGEERERERERERDIGCLSIETSKTGLFSDKVYQKKERAITVVLGAR